MEYWRGSNRPHNKKSRDIFGMNVSAYAACGWAAIVATCAQAQSASSLDEVVVTAKSLEEELPQQLALYGTRVDTISAAKIQNGGYLDVAGALEALAPGLYITTRRRTDH